MKKIPLFSLLLLFMLSRFAWAHDPIFSPGPHVIYKGGIETALNIEWSDDSSNQENIFSAGFAYGLSGNLAIGAEVPYVVVDKGEDGLNNPDFFVKYRFWRRDTLAAQQALAILGKLSFNTGNSAIRRKATDTLVGLSYGYESLKWYGWISMRYRFNGTTDEGTERGDKVLFDLAGGIRLKPPRYYEPDTVLILEFNGIWTARSSFDGIPLVNTGGKELFVSPGIFWTYRNFAIKSGIQLPIYNNKNSTQQENGYRIALTFEYHW